MTITIPMRPLITILLAFSILAGILILTEPDGFNGMRLGATRAETEKVAKLQNCEVVRSGHPEIIQFENLKCNTTLVVDRRDFRGHVLFSVPPNGEGTLWTISADFGKGEFAFVRAAFIKRYGLPHYFTLSGGQHLTWASSKALIIVTEVVGDHASFSISPNWRAIKGAMAVESTQMRDASQPESVR